jgi:hypothetical protein
MKKNYLLFLSIVLLSISITSFAMEGGQEEPSPDIGREDIGGLPTAEEAEEFWKIQHQEPFYKRHPVITGLVQQRLLLVL